MLLITIALVFGAALVGARIVDDNLDRNNYVENYRHATTVDQDFENYGVGPYLFRFATSNGIKRSEQGNVFTTPTGQHIMRVTGSYEYPDIHGNMIQVKYVADENGFQPEGPHIRVPNFSSVPLHEQTDILQRNLNILAPQVIATNNNNLLSQPIYVPVTPQPFAATGESVDSDSVQVILPNLVRAIEEHAPLNGDVKDELIANRVNAILESVQAQNQAEVASPLVNGVLLGGEIPPQGADDK